MRQLTPRERKNRQSRAKYGLRKIFIREAGQWMVGTEQEGEGADQEKDICGIVTLLIVLFVSGSVPFSIKDYFLYQRRKLNSLVHIPATILKAMCVSLPKQTFQITFSNAFEEFAALRRVSSFRIWSHESKDRPTVSVSLLVLSKHENI